MNKNFLIASIVISYNVACLSSEKKESVARKNKMTERASLYANVQEQPEQLDYPYFPEDIPQLLKERAALDDLITKIQTRLKKTDNTKCSCLQRIIQRFLQ